MNFACELMDLCRGTQELEAVLGVVENDLSCDPLARLRLAIQYDEKKASYSPLRVLAASDCRSYITIRIRI